MSEKANKYRAHLTAVKAEAEGKRRRDEAQAALREEQERARSRAALDALLALKRELQEARDQLAPDIRVEIIADYTDPQAPKRPPHPALTFRLKGATGNPYSTLPVEVLAEGAEMRIRTPLPNGHESEDLGPAFNLRRPADFTPERISSLIKRGIEICATGGHWLGARAERRSEHRSSS